MAAKKFTRAPGTGRPIPVPDGNEPPGDPADDALSALLGQFADAISVIEVTCLALEGAQEETPESVTPYAVSLRQGLVLINQAYERFDRALVLLETTTRKRAKPARRPKGTGRRSGPSR